METLLASGITLGLLACGVLWLLHAANRRHHPKQ